MNRRDLLKLFGIGATVLPMVDGKALVEAPAKLITQPEVSILEPPKPLAYGAQALEGMFVACEPVTLQLRLISDSGVVDFSAKTFISKINMHMANVTTYGSIGRQIPVLEDPMEWEIRGHLVDDWQPDFKGRP